MEREVGVVHADVSVLLVSYFITMLLSYVKMKSWNVLDEQNPHAELAK